MIYSELTQRYFDSPPNVGRLDATGHPGALLRRGEAGSREGGTWVQFDFLVACRRIEAARFLALGCPHVIAAAAWVAERAVGLMLPCGLPDGVRALQRRFEVPTEKLGRLLIIEDAWDAANRVPITI